MYLVFGVMDYQDWVFVDLQGEEIVFGGNFVGYVGDQLFFVEDFLYVDFEQVLVVVEGLWQ